MLLRNLLGWLRTVLFRSRYEYIDLGGGQFLKIKRGTATIVNADEVPARILRPMDNTTMRATRKQLEATPDLPRASRVPLLKRLLPFEVARRAASSDVITGDVRQHPELVDADSDFEAQLKLAIAAGEPLEPLLGQQPDLSESDLSDMLGPDWIAKWGYNQYGSDLPAHLAGSPVDDATRDAIPASRSSIHASGLAASGRKTVRASNISDDTPTGNASGESGTTGSSTATTGSATRGSTGRPTHNASEIGSATTQSSSQGRSRSTTKGSSPASSGGSVGSGDVGGGDV